MPSLHLCTQWSPCKYFSTYKYEKNTNICVAHCKCCWWNKKHGLGHIPLPRMTTMCSFYLTLSLGVNIICIHTYEAQTYMHRHMYEAWTYIHTYLHRTIHIHEYSTCILTYAMYTFTCGFTYKPICIIISARTDTYICAYLHTYTQSMCMQIRTYIQAYMHRYILTILLLCT